MRIRFPEIFSTSYTVFEVLRQLTLIPFSLIRKWNRIAAMF
jgi:hypothetical protein